MILSWNDGRDSFEFDATLSVSIESTATVTKRKVERGAATADHKRSEHRSVRASGIVTNTPIDQGTFRKVEGTKIDISALQLEEPEDRIAKAIDTLESLRATSVIVSFDAGHTRVDSAELVAVTVSRDSAVDAATFEIVIEEIFVASTSSIVAPTIPRETRATRARNGGTANAEEVRQEDDRSVAAAGADGIREGIREAFGDFFG